MEHTILIIGGGEIGTAIHTLLMNNPDNTTYIWDLKPSCRSTIRPLKDLATAATIVFVCVPSNHVRQAIKQILPYLQKTTTIVSLAKGLEQKSHETMEEVLLETLPAKQPFGLLQGPMLAEELCQGFNGFAVFATRSKKAQTTLLKLFETTNLRVTTSSDVIGTAIVGVMKNIYAIGYGIIKELHWSNNDRGWYFTQVIKEMEHALIALGGKKATVISLAGIGDLFATATSAFSNNATYGKIIVTKKGKLPHAEGADALTGLLKRLKGKNNFPILKALDKVIRMKYRPKSVFDNLREK